MKNNDIDDYSNFFMCLSVDGGYGTDPKVSLFIYPTDTDSGYFRSFIKQEIYLSSQNADEWSSPPVSNIFHNAIQEVHMGDSMQLSDYVLNGLYSPSVDDFQFVRNTYLSADDNGDVEMVWNIANIQSPFKNSIGMYYDNATGEVGFNKNIVFNTTTDLANQDYKNMVRWSDVNSNAIPDLNFKTVKEPVVKIIGAPSFLQYQYQNTFLIFTRNNIHRFILDPNVEGWGGSASSLIDEKTQYGLLAPRSLVRVAEGLFWLSETGVVKWDPKGFNLISKNRINIPINEKSIGFYNSLENQYILWCNDQAYVYHIDRDLWVTFSGSDLVNILEVSTLTGGTREDNVNLLLTKDPIIAEGEPGIYKIYEYPSSEITENDSSIKTKDMFFEKGVLKRVKLNYKEGDSEYSRTILISNITKNDKDGNEIIKSNEIGSIENGKWRGVSNANSRGKSVNFEVKNADEIESIMYDIQFLSRVKQ
jgi:hypothetical protein